MSRRRTAALRASRSSRSLRACAGLASLLILAVACAGGSSLDFSRAGRALRGNPPPPAPVLTESPAADLPAPTGVRATRDELREIAVSFDPVLAGNVGGYAVERSLQPTGPFSRVAVLTDRFETGLLDRGFDLAPKSPAAAGEPGLGDGAEYHYRVRAFDAEGRLSASISEVASGRTAPRPSAPESLAVVSRLPRKVALAWRPSSDPTVKGYVVLRSPGASGPFEIVGEVEGRQRSHFVDRGLGDLHVFYYQIAAVNAAGARGEPSEPVLALTKPDPLPPVGLRLESSAPGATRIAWDANVEPDVIEYRVLRRVRAEEEPELVGTVRAPETALQDTSDGAVSYLVIAVDADGLESEPAELPVGAPPSS